MCLRMLSSVCGRSSLRRLYRDRKLIIVSTAVVAQMAWIASNRSLRATSASVISSTSPPVWTCCAAMLSCTLRMYCVIRTAAELEEEEEVGEVVQQAVTYSAVTHCKDWFVRVEC